MSVTISMRPIGPDSRRHTGRPLSLRDVGPPLLPVLDTIAVFLETFLLFGEVFIVVKDDHFLNGIPQIERDLISLSTSNLAERGGRKR